MLVVAGVNAIDCSTAGVTIRVALPEIEPDVAVMVEVPVAKPVAAPEPLMLATAVFAEAHATLALMSFEVPSE